MKTINLVILGILLDKLEDNHFLALFVFLVAIVLSVLELTHFTVHHYELEKDEQDN